MIAMQWNQYSLEQKQVVLWRQVTAYEHSGCIAELSIRIVLCSKAQFLCLLFPLLLFFLRGVACEKCWFLLVLFLCVFPFSQRKSVLLFAGAKFAVSSERISGVVPAAFWREESCSACLCTAGGKEIPWVRRSDPGQEHLKERLVVPQHCRKLWEHLHVADKQEEPAWFCLPWVLNVEITLLTHLFL